MLVLELPSTPPSSNHWTVGYRVGLINAVVVITIVLKRHFLLAVSLRNSPFLYPLTLHLDYQGACAFNMA